MYILRKIRKSGYLDSDLATGSNVTAAHIRSPPRCTPGDGLGPAPMIRNKVEQVPDMVYFLDVY
jgi:hypothetical protein